MAQVKFLLDGSAIVDSDELAWTPLDVFTWVAFRERRSGADFLFPRAGWSCDWRNWPPEYLAKAFDELATGVPWTPESGSYEEARVKDTHAWAQRVMEWTQKDAGELRPLLRIDTERYQRDKIDYLNAKEQVMAAVRDGRLPVWGRKAHGRAKPNHDAEPEQLNPRLFTHQPRVLNEAGWVDGPAGYMGPWWDEVRFDAPAVLTLWPMVEGIAARVVSLCPFPEAEHIAPWAAASWRAFGTLEAPEHIAKHRSFDQGTVRLPDEMEARHAARLEEHQRFDKAEREVMDLLASGQVKADGQPPANEVPHKPKPGGHTVIPAGTFADTELVFSPEGNLIARLPVLDRLFPDLELRVTEASPENPLWFSVRIKAAGLRQAWGIGPIEPPTPVIATANHVGLRDHRVPAAQAPKAARRGGMSYAKQDAPLLEEMRVLLQRGEAMNIWQAALKVAHKAESENTLLESRAKRLLKRYSEAFSPEHDGKD